MTERTDKPAPYLELIQLIPNMLTTAGICAGLSAIRFGVEGNFVLAVQLIVAACVLDGLDGKIARLLKSDSKMGAELDSLADFLNFGVAPGLLLYFWALQDMRGFAWISVLVYAICCVLRLARFNVGNKPGPDNEPVASKDCFVGVPSPAGALLVLLPMTVSFAFPGAPLLPDVLICIHMVVVGLAMISRIPTWSFKRARISRGNVKYFLLGFAFVGGAVVTFAWITLVAICLVYVGTVIWCFFAQSRANLKTGK
ncbi:CDP-diacylglycerol--serine O-phosphatidyltransferase [Antarctobacter jejuensis]|uniref:CDP-diacylglycerol--serine O-phosphatidyltransferase n=1 Tax=Antarctobacter jejuensis TaxID=1439938 RepID=UPI003FCF1C49